jgi:hypothetical protein
VNDDQGCIESTRGAREESKNYGDVSLKLVWETDVLSVCVVKNRVTKVSSRSERARWWAQ